MIQTVILLAIIAVMFILGIWLTFFGRRVFRFSGMLFGFALGVGGVLFAAYMLNLPYDSLPILIATPVLGLGLGLLGAFVPTVGAGLGGLVIGYFYGVGLVFAADYFTGGAIPPMVFTGVSVGLILVFFILCLIKREAAKWLTTALAGSYVAALAVTMALTWFLAGGFSTSGTAGSFITQLIALFNDMGPGTRLIMLGGAAVFGMIGCIVQARSGRAGNAYLDELAMDDRFEQEESFDEDDEEEVKPKRKRKLRKRDRDLPDEEDEDDPFAEEEAPARAVRRKVRKRDEDLYDEPAAPPSAPDAAPARESVSRVAAVQQTAVPAQKASASLDQTQVFKRVNVAPTPLSPKPSAPTYAPTPASAPAAPAKTSAQPEPPTESRLSQSPSFTPRSQRRR
jgi:hypothetical protein